MTHTELIGITGATLILIAFSLGQFGKWQVTDKKYDAVNAFGSLFLLIYAYLLVSYPFMILNSVWLLVSLRQLLKKG